MPAPHGNSNAVKHGMTARYHLTVGDLPKKLRKVQSASRAYVASLRTP